MLTSDTNPFPGALLPLTKKLILIIKITLKLTLTRKALLILTLKEEKMDVKMALHQFDRWKPVFTFGDGTLF